MTGAHEGSMLKALSELQALSALIRRPPLDDVLLKQDVALRTARAIEDLAALLAPPPAVDGWRIDRGSANSHVFDDQLLFGDECVGFVDADWSDRILTMLAAAPTPPAASLPAPSALVEACEPFKHVAEPIIHNDRDRWNPDEWSKRLNNLTVGHFRDLHAALAHHSAQPASEDTLGQIT